VVLGLRTGMTSAMAMVRGDDMRGKEATAITG
jgi:hypothetical protein